MGVGWVVEVSFVSTSLFWGGDGCGWYWGRGVIEASFVSADFGVAEDLGKSWAGGGSGVTEVSFVSTSLGMALDCGDWWVLWVRVAIEVSFVSTGSGEGTDFGGCWWEVDDWGFW